MRFLSLFSGIGGFDLGLERAGMECVGQVEIDPYCRRVLARHWPDVARYEDVRSVGLGRNEHHIAPYEDGATARLDDAQWRSAGVDLVCGGFPCQDLSVAGQRAGLDGARSGLWFEFQRILRELRPRWALIENVPGLLSSNGGRDFAVILDGLGECGFGGIAWAVLDSQHFGVPQRRRRVFVVGGPSRRAVEQVLSLCESCGGHPAAGRAAGEDVAGTLRGGTRGSDDPDRSTYIPFVAHTLRADGFDASEDGTGRGTPLVSIRTAQTGVNGWGVDESDTAYTLDGANGQAVAFQAKQDGASSAIAPTLRALEHDASHANSGWHVGVAQGASVRRLTPVECARLQGFPDDWLDPEAGQSGADGPQYRALGNAVTVPVIEYLGRRIMAVEEAA